MDPAEIVRASLDDGDSPDQVARALTSDHCLAPIPAIKAMRVGGGMTVGEAKELIHRNLPTEQQEAAERLWEELTDDGELMVADESQ